MHNQRLLYSETKKPRVGSINKENNIRLFNDSFINQAPRQDKRNIPQLRYDYQRNNRTSHNTKTLPPFQQTILQRPNYVLKRAQQDQTLPARQLVSNPKASPQFPQPVPKPKTSQPLTIPPSFPSCHNQIQSYTNKLLQNNKSYQEQIFSLKQQNNRLKTEIQRSIAENIRNRMGQQKSEEIVKHAFNQQIEKLVGELKDILKAKELMQLEYNKYINELSEEHAKEGHTRQQSFLKSEEFFREKLDNMNSHIALSKEEKEKQYFEASQCKLRLMKQIDQLNYSVEKVTLERKQTLRCNQEMVTIIKRLEKELKQTHESLQQRQIQVYKVEQQKNAIIIELKQQNKHLCDGGKGLQDRIAQLNSSMDRKEIHFDRLEKQLLERKRDDDQRASRLVQKSFQLEQTRKHRKSVEERNLKLEKAIEEQKYELQNLIQELQMDGKALASELSDTYEKLASVEMRLQAASSQVENMQAQLSRLNLQACQVQQLNRKYKKDNIQFLEQLEILNIQNKSIKQDKILKENHIRTLQKMCEQLQKNRQREKQKDYDRQRVHAQKQLQQKKQIYQRKQLYQKSLRLVQKENYSTQVEDLYKRQCSSQMKRLEQENYCLKGQIQVLVGEYEQKLIKKQFQWQSRCECIQKEVQYLLQMHEQCQPTAFNINIPTSTKPPRPSLVLKSIQKSKMPQNSPQERSPYLFKQQRSPFIVTNNFQHVKNDFQQSAYQNTDRNKPFESINRKQALGSVDRAEPQIRQKQYGREFLFKEQNSFRKKQNQAFDIRQIESRLKNFSYRRKD